MLGKPNIRASVYDFALIGLPGSKSFPRFILIFVGFLALGVMFAQAQEQELVEPPAASSEVKADIRTERFDDWEIVCSGKTTQAPTTGEVQAGACRLQQAQAVNDGKDVAFLFNIVLQKGKPIAIISVPLNVYLPAGVELRIDQGKTHRAAFETCNISGCHAGFALNDTLLIALKRGIVLDVSLRDTQSTKVPVTVSLKGITAGLKRLDELSRGGNFPDNQADTQ